MRITLRESDVLDLVAMGLTNKEIATKLQIGPDTVKVHLVNLRIRYGMVGTSRCELLLWAQAHGFPRAKAQAAGA